jgi:3-methyl-2-oxobutanoate hydroxymethyltransferase
MKKTVPEIAGRKQLARVPDKNPPQKIAMVTAYDYPTALLADRAGIDVILVGDSLAMVVLGYESTVSVTMDEMLHHAKAVRRGAKEAVLVGDLPFGSYQEGPQQAIHNAIRFLKEAGMDAVKLEGGATHAETVRALVQNGIPVMGHIGLLPQLVSATGGFKVQGRDTKTAQRLIDDAKALEEAGCFSIVLEAIPDRLAGLITRSVNIPTIGIGAGPECDGQVLVMHDMLGLFDRFTPRFVKKYADGAAVIEEALTQYRREVQAGEFPGPEHSFTIKDEVIEGLYGDKLAGIK